MHQDLKFELQKMWHVKAKVVPVVIGALELHQQRLRNIPGNHDARPLLKVALLGSAHILRRVLDLSLVKCLPILVIRISIFKNLPSLISQRFKHETLTKMKGMFGLQNC